MVEKRNIVLVTFDSLRADHCSFLGYNRKTTPMLDKLAKKGIVFTNAVASSVATPASMFTIFTGRYPKTPFIIGNLNYKQWSSELRSKCTLAQILSKYGYITGAIHSNPAVSHCFGFDKGFSYFHDYLDTSSIKMLFLRKLLSLDKLRNIVASLTRSETSITWESYINYIQNFLDICRKSKKPYFLWILLLDTHIPYNPPKNKWCKKNIFYKLYINWKARKYFCDSNKITHNEQKCLIDLYDDSILYADGFVKELLKITEADQPIYIFHSDHGEGFGEHGFYYHPPLLYDEILRVPLIIYGGIDNLEEGRYSHPVSLINLYYTILLLSGYCNNISILNKYSILNKSCKYSISRVYSPKLNIAVRTTKWKYIKHGNTIELYDLSMDAAEKINLVADTESSVILKQMEYLYTTYMKSFSLIDVL